MPDPLPQNKTVAFVSNSAWSVYNFRIDVINHFLRQGLFIFVLAPDDEYSKKLVAAGCRFIAIEFNNKGESPLLDIFFYRKLRKYYRQLRPDFIFHYVAKPNIYGSLAAAAENIPCVAVITGLGYPFAKRNWLFKVIRALYKKALKNTREVWFLNNEDAKVFITEKIVSINKMKVLPGEGVNTEHFSPAFALRAIVASGLSEPHIVISSEARNLPTFTEAEEEETRSAPGDRKKPFQFLMSTRLLKSKGVGLYADAARILKKKHYDVSFSLIGFFEKNHPDSITEEDIGGWQKEGLITYYGFADDVRSFLLKADCFVFPSFYNEGVPRCLLEAASMELPIITTFNRGCKEVVLNNSNGYICNRNDAFDLADKMEKMINLSVEERCRMGRNGRQLVLKKFGMAKVVQEYTNTLISAFEN